jgi:hypothetical protein
MASWKAWKKFEKEVAEHFGGLRRSRISYSERAGDIIHPTLSIECKYGEQVPKWCRLGKYQVIFFGKYRLYHSSYTKGLLDSPDIPDALLNEKSKFLDRAFAQAVAYDPTKQPIVCLKSYRYEGFVIVERRQNGNK